MHVLTIEYNVIKLACGIKS